MNETLLNNYLNKKKSIFNIRKTRKVEKTAHWNRNEILYLYCICIIQKLINLEKSQVNELHSKFLGLKTKKQIFSKINCSKNEIKLLIDHFHSIIPNIFYNNYCELIRKLSFLLYEFFITHSDLFVNSYSFNEKCSLMLFEDKKDEKEIKIEMEENLCKKLLEISKGTINYDTLAQCLICEKNNINIDIGWNSLSTFFETKSSSNPEWII